MAGLDPAISEKPHEIPGSRPGMTIGRWSRLIGFRS